MRGKNKQKGRGVGAISILLIVFVFVAVMSLQIHKLHEKEDLLADRQENLEQQYADETERAEELEELNLFTQSMDYIKELAHKLGFVSENEIIFKENDE